ncbi:HNH endonuclease signature motif containing protein [Providencia alcalifaciens]|uniref:HNH endonuclease signature motif containing protein n=1 Tax=Providencia alcalifaciens TaxID=126385 RepID=UPI0004532837|nr:HNH endonuclease signature motif containing protein [Providencia alcalifaciens]EUD07842.1 HNH endonuclease domain protein [Providencia alcalifaciens R90-1475]
MEDIFIKAPHYPCDLSELKEIENYIEKIELFHQKISELDSKLIEFSDKCYRIEDSYLRDVFAIRNYILRSFFQDSDNKDFSVDFYSKKYAEIQWEGFIYKRNPPCQICGENRSIDKCHIIPARLGGQLTTDNLLFLCPTHHRLFDRFMLTKAEWGVINWDSKSPESSKYAETVTFEKHKIFWDKIYQHDFSKIVSDGVLYKCDYDYIESLILYIKELFYKNIFSNISSINKLIDPNIASLVKNIIRLLIKHNIIVSLTTTQSTRLAFIDPANSIPEHIIREITAEVN